MTEPTVREEARVRTLYTAEEVSETVAGLAAEMYEKYKDKNPLFVGFLKGCTPFVANLMQALVAHAESEGEAFHPEVDYMVISTYGTGTEAREPRIVFDLANRTIVRDRLVVMVDDVLDTGNTMQFAEQHFRLLGATDVDSAVLVQKTGQEERTLYPEATFCGFDCQDSAWLIGMGMNGDPRYPEHSEAGRWLGYIAIVEK